MWIDELLQGQERNELAMLCKLVFDIVCNVTLIMCCFPFFLLDRHTSQVEKKMKIAHCKDAGYLR